MKQSASFQGLNIDKNSIINLEKGKLPPQAIELEEVVLGAMMIDKKGVDEVIDILNLSCVPILNFFTDDTRLELAILPWLSPFFILNCHKLPHVLL